MNYAHLGEFRVQSVRKTDWPIGDNPKSIADYWRKQVTRADWYDGDKEALVGICLSTRSRISGHYLVGVGQLDRIDIHAREVFRPAIVAAAHRIVLAHNHPSGDATPSDSDIHITRRLEGCANLLGLKIEDHVIIGHRKHASLREMRYMP